MVNHAETISLSPDYLDISIAYLVKQGIDKERCLRETGVSEIVMDGQLLVTLTIPQYQQIVSSLKRLSEDPAVGVFLGQQYNVSSHGYLGHVALCSQNIWEAVELVAKYTMLRNRLLTMDWHVEDACAVLEFSTHLQDKELEVYVMEVAMSTMNRLLRFYLKTAGSDSSIEMRFKHAEPEYLQTYQDVFRCPLSFGDQAFQIRVPLEACYLPLRCANTTLFTLIEKQCEAQLAELDEQNVAGRVRHILYNNPGPFPSQDEVARQLKIAPRTLRKRLKDNDTSYQQILDDVRCDLALSYLKEPEWPIESIARLLGFSDRYHFSTAFKKWKNISPAAYRKALNYSAEE